MILKAWVKMFMSAIADMTAFFVFLAFVVLGWVMASGTYAQVEMDVPFVPIGGTYVPSVNSLEPIQAEYTFQGKDENGADIYATEWVEIEPDEWQDSVERSVARPGTQPIRGLLSSAGMTVVPTAGDGLRVMNPLPPDTVIWDHLGTCRRNNPPTSSPPSGTVLGTTSTESLGSCADLLRAYHGPTNFDAYDWLPQAGAGACESNGAMWWSSPGGGLYRGSFTPNETQCVDSEPDYPVPEAEPLTQGQSMELVLSPVPGPGETDFPQPLARPVTNNEFTTIINNNVTNITNLSSVATTITNNYEAEGDIGDIPNPSTERPPGIPAGGGSQAGEMGAFCEENPSALACVDVGGLDLSELEGQDQAIETELTGIVGEVEGYLAEAEAYRIGDGPAIGPSPGACPMAGGIPIGETELTLDTTTVCEVAGGPVRMLIGLLSYLAAAIIILRGLTA